jgi:hypothetical protein
VPVDERGTVAAIDGMFSVMIITTGLAFLLAMPGLIGFSADMQQGFQVTQKSMQAQDIGKAIIFSEEGMKAAIAFSKEPPLDDGKTEPNGTYENKTTKQWLEELGINVAYNDFDVYMKTESMNKSVPVLEVHDSITDIFNADDPIAELKNWLKKTVYNLMYDYFIGGEQLQGKFNTQITTDYGKVILIIEKGAQEIKLP